MTTKRRPHGFSLVDLVALLAIVAACCALLWPKIGRSRAAAQEVYCMNKMKQLGLAILNHSSVYKRLPATSNQGNRVDPAGIASVWWPEPGTGAATGAIPSVGYTQGAGKESATAGYGWIVRILPFMDETALYNAISRASGKFCADAFTPFNVAGERDGQNTGATFSIKAADRLATKDVHFAAVLLDELICPAFGGSPTVAPSAYHGQPAGAPPATYGGLQGSATLGSQPEFAAITNYLALAATHFTCMQYATEEKLAATTKVPRDAEPPNGMIVPGTGLSERDCTDGKGHTLMLCETLEPAMNAWYDGTTAWTTALDPNSLAKFPPSEANPGYDGVDNPDHAWVVPNGGRTALNVGPGDDKQVAYCPALAGYCATPRVISWGPSSRHPGGVVMHVAVDGSAHPISDQIDPTLYVRLVTRAGGEAVEIADAME
ncbi:MAG TPA: DUF1559 domain-containing protein [Pirellulales bacterium]|nr:DUF1559 domain-containing protein [Pirellulales bacterium]